MLYIYIYIHTNFAPPPKFSGYAPACSDYKILNHHLLPVFVEISSSNVLLQIIHSMNACYMCHPIGMYLKGAKIFKLLVFIHQHCQTTIATILILINCVLYIVRRYCRWWQLIKAKNSSSILLFLPLLLI